MHILPHDAEEMAERGRRSPVLATQEMLSILRRCPSAGMESLEIESVADEDDTELSRFLASAFPNL